MNETVLTISLVGVAVYFSVLIVRGLLKYLSFRRVRRTALVTWRMPAPAGFAAQILLGVINVPLAVIGIVNQRPHGVFGPLSIALYFTAILPLLTRIPRGLYGEGVWADSGYVPYEQIQRFAFREGPDLELLLVPRGNKGAVRLHVPPAEYGTVRKILGDKIRSHVLHLEGGILGLESSDASK